MKCNICNKLFYFKKTFKNMLEIENENVCPSCYKKYPIKIDYVIIPIGKYNLKVFTLFNKVYKIPDNSYIKEFSRIYSYVFNKNEHVPILIYNKFYLTESNINKLEIISTIFESDVYIICNNLID